MVLTAAGTASKSYQGRIQVTPRSVILKAVTDADEGSYTVMDKEGVIQEKLCLNVKGEIADKDGWPESLIQDVVFILVFNFHLSVVITYKRLKTLMYFQSVNRVVVNLSNVFPSLLSNCVLEHKHFEKLQYGKKLKINLVVNSSLAQLYCIPSVNATPVLLLDKGEFTNVTESSFSI